MSGRKKIAVILSRFPFPLDKGDKLRAYHQIGYLSRFHDVYVYALSNEEVDETMMKALSPFCKGIHVFRLSRSGVIVQALLSFIKNIPVQVGYFYSPRHAKKIRESIMALQPDTVYCQLSRTALYGKDLPFRKVIDLQDAFSTNYERIQNSYQGLMKYFYRRESLCMRDFEIKMIGWFDISTIISAFDKGKIQIEPNPLVVVSNGVDTSYYKSAGRTKKYDILFSGNLTYIPNKHAVKFLAEKIAPALAHLRPDIQIVIAGSSGDTLKKYESSNIQIRGWVNDMSVLYDEARIFVSPLFTGAGLQNKLLEAMSMGIPCITTAITNASLLATENEQVLLADNVDEFVSKIIVLLDDAALRQRISTNARIFIEENYNWDKVNQKLADLL